MGWGGIVCSLFQGESACRAGLWSNCLRGIQPLMWVSVEQRALGDVYRVAPSVHEMLRAIDRRSLHRTIKVSAVQERKKCEQLRAEIEACGHAEGVLVPCLSRGVHW